MDRLPQGPQPLPTDPETLRIGVDFEAVRARLAECAIDDAARTALGKFAPLAAAANLPDALRADCRALGFAAGDTDDPARSEAADRFATILGTFANWDFEPEWLNALTTRWLEFLAAGGRFDQLDALAARILGRCIRLLSDPERGAGKTQLAAIEAVAQLLIFITGVLADASASYAEMQHQRALEFDDRSGLPNLHRALTRLGAAMGEARDGEFIAVVVLRIEVTPALLRMPSTLARQLLGQVIDRFTAVLRPRDQLFAGTEWELVAILPALSTAGHVSLATARLLQTFSEPFPVFGREYRLVPAIGAALFPDAGRQPEALLLAARLALHEAQRSTGRYELYRSEMEYSAARHAAIEEGLLEALRDDRLELYLQPLVDAGTGLCRHAEALLRWPEAQGERVPPQVMVEIAEEAGVAPQFCRWLVTRAARMLSELAQSGIDLCLSINLTANDLRDEELPDVVEQALAIWKVPADRLMLELTESAMIADEQCSLPILHRLRGLGCGLALDDFGTGYSSMAYLRQLPLNVLKIDQIFIRRMEETAQDREIVRCMVQLAHSLGLEVVAEGVETEAVKRMLDHCGCQRLQGYYFSRPVPLPQFQRWWHEQQVAAATSHAAPAKG